MYPHPCSSECTKPNDIEKEKYFYWRNYNIIQCTYTETNVYLVNFVPVYWITSAYWITHLTKVKWDKIGNFQEWYIWSTMTTLMPLVHSRNRCWQLNILFRNYCCILATMFTLLWLVVYFDSKVISYQGGHLFIKALLWFADKAGNLEMIQNLIAFLLAKSHFLY
jgi:hypothetical protein